MKKIFLLLLMSATFLCMAAQKKEVVIHPSEQTSTTGGRKYPRTPEPSIYAYTEDGVLTISIDRYTGSVATTIDDSSDNTVMYDMQYMSGSTSYTIDVSALSEDTYTIYFTFSDGREYYGTFNVL